MKTFPFARKLSLSFLCLLLTFILLLPQISYAYWIWSPESGKFINPEGASDDAAEQEYNHALGLYEAKNLDGAADVFSGLTKKYPRSRVASDAQFKLASIYEQQNQYDKAFKAYQKLFENYPNSEKISEVIGKQFRIGNVFLSGEKPKLMGVPILPALPKAIEVFEQIIKNAPFSEYGDQATFNLGIACSRQGNLQKSIETFQRLVDNYPDSPLVPDAKFQLGEVSYQMSKNLNRSQEGLETAESYFDSFLSDYPETNVKEKALELKKAIDEKNAEKNYKIAEYYEKENYLDSAVIYYEDVVRNYESTSWAEKAKEKLEIFRQPVKYIKSKEGSLENEMTDLALRKTELKEQLEAVPAEDQAQKQDIEARIEEVEKNEKVLKGSIRSFDSRKVSDIRRRRQALKRKEKELKEKVKALELKKKAMKDNKSEDLQKAFASWSESLSSEKAALEQEKLQMEGIEGELGIEQFRIPFTGKPEDVNALKQMNVDELNDLIEEKKIWEVKKEELYEFRTSILGRVSDLQGDDIERLSQKKEFREMLEQSGGDLNERTLSLEKQKQELDHLRTKLDEKEAQLVKLGYGKKWSSSVIDAPNKIVKASWNLVTFSSDDPREKLREARERQSRLSKKIDKKQELVKALEGNFEGEIGSVTLSDPGTETSQRSLPEDVLLKKRLKLIEREIRWRSEEIEDRNATKNRKIGELDGLLKQVRERVEGLTSARRTVAAPAVGTYKFLHAFLFGLKDRDESIRNEALRAEAQKPSGEMYEKIQQLREEIEFESILIEARAAEMGKLKKELKTVKAQAQDKGISYRSVLIEKPGHLIDDVVKSAKKVLPGEEKERHDILIERLDEENRKLKDLESQRSLLEDTVRDLEKEVNETPVAAPAEERKEVQSEEEAAESQDTEKAARIESLRQEVESLRKDFGSRRAAYEEKQKEVQKDLKRFYKRNYSKRLKERFGSGDEDSKGRRELFDKESRKAAEEILKIVRKEEKLISKQQELLTDKQEKLAEKIGDYKKRSDSKYELLESERDQILQQVSQVKGEKRNLMEEKKKMIETLKTEVTSLER